MSLTPRSSSRDLIAVEMVDWETKSSSLARVKFL